jgi:adenylate kinase family enzyme
MEVRFDAADTIIFLDLPRTRCVRNVIKRRWQYRDSTRPDMGEGCPEKLDPVFLEWIWNYPKNQRPGILRLLNRYQGEKPVHILHSHAEVREFLDDVRRRRSSQVGVNR